MRDARPERARALRRQIRSEIVTLAGAILGVPLLLLACVLYVMSQ